jgi:hypothetical protein
MKMEQVSKISDIWFELKIRVYRILSILVTWKVQVFYTNLVHCLVEYRTLGVLQENFSSKTQTYNYLIVFYHIPIYFGH